MADLFAPRGARHDSIAMRGESPRDEQDDQTVRSSPTPAIDHDLARRLILEQTEHLLPPVEANALADHLLECDRCFRFAQDVAHHERQSGKHPAV